VRGNPDTPRKERQETVLSLLRDFSGMEPLKQLVWSELNYHQVNQPVSRRDWPKAAHEALAEDPVLLAGEGDFHVIYSRLHSSGRLHVTDERAVATRLLRDHLYALFVFSDAEQQNWHFVNVRYDPLAEKQPDKRRIFRRIAVGPQERLRTASERIAMLDLQSVSPTLFGLSPLDIQKRHDDAFNVEAVTQAFFKDYAGVFRALQQDLSSQTGNVVWAHDYALQFLNRLMFLYFVQRKRWLGDNTEFMAGFWSTYRRARPKPDSFFSDWLSVLFFEAFNNRWAPRPYMPSEVNNVLRMAPYLNGGLFERNDLDTKYHFEITDDQFGSAFDFLEGYNFTIAEDSPLDQEVAVDPEMIGRVYESLVNVEVEADQESHERHDWGIFYTPRTEIDLMCRLALVDNLANHLGQEHKNALYEAVFAFDPDEKQAADDQLGRVNLWPEVYQRLCAITAVDPACGSGSFLVGMLHVLADLRERANRALGSERDDPQYRYDLKKEIIGQSLYGVDVMEWAVRVAELRLWLQLVVDADLDLGLRKHRPLLPNLDLKIRFGDSLVQEVGGVDLSHVHGRAGLPSAIKGRLTRLKGEKLKYYRNERTGGAWSKEQIDHEERRLFQDILSERAQELTRRAKRLESQIAHPEKQMGIGLTDAPPGKATQLELKIDEWRRDLEQVTADLAEVGEAAAALGKTKQVPFVWDIGFVEVFEGETAGFDVVIGNPPYVRQEKIAPPRPRGAEAAEVPLEERRAYKAKLIRSVYALYPTFFGYKANRDTVARKLDAKSDLYVYFYFHGLSLLNPAGAFCFITSNSWLDVGYGRDLQEFLLRHGHVRLVLDNQVKRSFSGPDVNTVIALLGAPDDSGEGGLDRTARFVMCTVPFEHILSPVALQEMEDAGGRRTYPEFRVHPRKQRDLLDESMVAEAQAKPGKRAPARRYQANKWGGKYLRAPEIYWRILEKAGDKLVRLGEIAEVRRGFTTGANDFFYVKVLEVKDGIARVLAGDGSEHEIEEEFLRPVLRRPRECLRISLDPSEFGWNVLLCRREKSDLRGTAALRYIRWGERQGLNALPTCAGRPHWYDLGEPRPTHIAAKMTTKYRHYFPLSRIPVLVDNRFYEVRSQSGDPAVLAASLNSVLTALQLEMGGRTYGGGGGPLDIKVYEVDDLLIIRPDLLPPASWFWKHPVTSRPVVHVWREVNLPDRIDFDRTVLERVGLGDRVRAELYAEVVGLVRHRLEKARSLRPSATAAAIDEPFGDVPEDEGDERDEE